MARQRKTPERKGPPQEKQRSVQYDLFSRFIGDASNVSNAIEFWQSVPKYFFTPKLVDKIREPNGLAKSYRWKYKSSQEEMGRRVEREYEVKFQPAQIDNGDGEKAYFPGVTEELVEEVLCKLLCDNNYVFHDVKNSETWVQFSLSMIRRELKARGKQRNFIQIRHAINVMSKCIITLYVDNKEVWTGSILQDLCTMDRDTYLEDSSSYHGARLPLFISKSINNLRYRQFNYERLMNCDTALARWLLKKMVLRFKQAGLTETYRFSMNTVQNESGHLQQGRIIDNRRKLEAAVQELKDRGAVADYKTEEKKSGRKIVDVIFIVTPSHNFSQEQIDANKKAKENQLHYGKIATLPRPVEMTDF